MTTPRSHWKRLRAWVTRTPNVHSSETDNRGGTHQAKAVDALRALLADSDIPDRIRLDLNDEFAQIEALLNKLERNDLHIAIFGRVSVGKSALANALLGHNAFDVGVLHGTTQTRQTQLWRAMGGSGLHLIDTPGINELSGEQREQLAFDVAGISDLVIFVVDADMTAAEVTGLKMLAQTQRPVLLVLNKADHYSNDERERLLARLREHAAGIVHAENVLAVAARPHDRLSLRIDANGNEQEVSVPQLPEVTSLSERVFAICEQEGKTLAALNASLFAGKLSDTVSTRIAAARQALAVRVIRNYCLAKGLAVALNPIPVADLLAAASLDTALVMHLGKIYGLPLTRSEAGALIVTIVTQLAALMSAIWGVHLVSSALKGASAGLSTLVTATAQGALAWYATELVGRATERYLILGKSWGAQGPKRVVTAIVNSLDRDSILREARSQILARLRD